MSEVALGIPSWLNLDVVEKVLRKSEDDNSIHVVDVFTKPATSKGDNYTSEMFRITIEFSRNQGDRTVTKKKSIIFKVVPTKGVGKQLIQASRIFHTEMSMMGDTLPKMNDVLGSSCKLSARMYYNQDTDPEFLAFEDLNNLGFKMSDRQDLFDLEHCLLAIRGLARFHASSRAVYEKDPKLKKLYYRGMFFDDHPPEMTTFFKEGTISLGKEIQNWPELDPSYGKKIEKLAETIYEKTTKTIKYRESEFNTLNHGDCWINNMLFRYNADGKPIDHIFVDFQLCFFGSPSFDLQYFLNTSPNEEVLESKVDYLLEEYLRTLSSTMKQVGCKASPPSLEELRKNMKEKMLCGFVAASCILPLVMMNKENPIDLNDIFVGGEKNYSNPSYTNANYRKVMVKRIPRFDKMGLFDL